MKEPLVTVITPSYNQALYLEETILSIINQDYKNIEYIIIDGGSTDESVEIIQKYKDKIAYWVSEKDKGQADAINKGFEKAKGDYICWVNSDDILYPHFIKRMMGVFSENPEIDFVYGDVDQGKDIQHKVIRKGRKITCEKIIRDIDVPIPQQATMWRSKVLNKVGVLNVDWNVLLDRDFFTRIVLNCKIKYIPETFAFFRNHELSKSIADSMRWTDEMPRYYENLFTVYHNYKKYKKECITNMYLYCASIAKEAGSILESDFIYKAKRTSKFFYYKIRFYKPLVNYIKAVFLKFI